MCARGSGIYHSPEEQAVVANLECVCEGFMEEVSEGSRWTWGEDVPSVGAISSASAQSEHVQR